MESTYGNRNHGNHRSIEDQLAEVISQTVGGGGKVVIPIFAIERPRNWFISSAGCNGPSGFPASPSSSTAPWRPK